MRRRVREGYDRCAGDYAAQRDAFGSDRYLEALAQRTAPRSRILDLGCGGGVPADRYLVGMGHELTGIDLSERQIALARANVPLAAYQVGDMCLLPFRSGSFEAVVSFYAIFHVPREEHLDLFGEVLRVLKPDGWFLATLGCDDWEGAEAFHGVMMVWSHYGRERNLELLGRAGFEVALAEVDESGGERHLVVLARKPATGA